MSDYKEPITLAFVEDALGGVIIQHGTNLIAAILQHLRLLEFPS